MGRQVIFAGKEYDGDDLTLAEKKLLQEELFAYLAYGNAFLKDLFELNWETIVGAAMVAKKKLDATFGGLFSGDSQFGMQLLRPGHVLRTTGATETPQNDWTFTFTADDDYWIGYNTNNTTAIHVDRDATVLALGVQFTQGEAPTVEELYWTIGGTTLPVMVIRPAWHADNVNRVRATRIPPLLLPSRETVSAQVYSIVPSTQEMVLLGLTFAKGSLLRTQAPSAVTT